MKSWLNKLQAILFPLVLLIVFIVVVLTIKAPIKETFEYIPNEGNNLMKSFLFMEEFSLYKQIWSDQPPLFTVILSYWLKLFGPSVYHGRILTLIFSSILLWAFYQTIRNFWGNLCASIAVVFLLLSTLYLRMSISIMADLPSLALAMLSIYCATLYRKYYLKHLLVLSGVFIALSLQTKLITAFLMPLIVLEIIRVKGLGLKDKKQSFFPVVLWLGSFLTVYLCITITFFHFDFHMFIQQLIKPHYVASAGTIPEYTQRTLFAIKGMIFNDWDIFLLGLIGTIFLFRQKKWQFFFPALWLVLTFVILLNYKLIRQYYYPLLSIPISWLAAISFSQFIANIRRNKRFLKMLDIFLYRLTGAIVILTILMLPIKYHRICRSLEGKTSPEEHKAVETLLKYRSHTHWIFTDRPIFAFYANILTPPELTMVSKKRRLSGNMPDDYLIYVLKKYVPEQILLARFQNYGLQVISYIEENYSKLYHCKFSSPEWFLNSNIWTIKRKWIAKRIEFTIRMWLANPNWTIIRKCFSDQKWLDRFNAIGEPIFQKEIKLYIRKDIVESKESIR